MAVPAERALTHPGLGSIQVTQLLPASSVQTPSVSPPSSCPERQRHVMESMMVESIVHGMALEIIGTNSTNSYIILSRCQAVGG